MRRGAFVLAIGFVAGRGPVAAQPAPPRIAVVALDPVVRRGPGVVVRLRLTRGADAAPLTGARIVAARAVSARGLIVRATGVSASGDGVYAIRSALEQPGDWTLEITVAVFDRSPVTAVASIRVVDDAPVPLRADPTAPAVAASAPQG